MACRWSSASATCRACTGVGWPRRMKSIAETARSLSPWLRSTAAAARRVDRPSNRPISAPSTGPASKTATASAPAEPCDCHRQIPSPTPTTEPARSPIAAKRRTSRPSCRRRTGSSFSRIRSLMAFAPSVHPPESNRTGVGWTFSPLKPKSRRLYDQSSCKKSQLCQKERAIAHAPMADVLATKKRLWPAASDGSDGSLAFRFWRTATGSCSSYPAPGRR